ncbi:DUF5606 domain-containing protein [Owenweeksia hongkongensis]|uniref:Uncharacterized protein n=1 Tax=Owenweeksia hongkongensis (strain DSM 17368 / CIP 108786 / JCM 12287 / NRRL B-23963 / UST20020801) TaxID=926562 RepID=G8R5E4_OWEHD|nr:DUF5606 domain-containing protein [Owenweeksia hongkongensis]AEV32189.1 hypothetical protein Oweho_1184 [Owenweeksia hongkongensis DSM 17368]
MELEGILAIGGKPGLYKLVAQSRGGVIVSSLIDDKKFPVTQASNVSALKDIAIYTYNEEVPLADVFQKIADKENLGQAISHKEKPEALRSYMLEILEDYDQERVYNSDLKKLFQWYNILQENGLVTKAEEKTEEPAEEVSSEEESK